MAGKTGQYTFDLHRVPVGKDQRGIGDPALVPVQMQRYLAGKEGLIGFFIGQIMKKSRGKANPGMVREMVQNKIREQA